MNRPLWLSMVQVIPLGALLLSPPLLTAGYLAHVALHRFGLGAGLHLLCFLVLSVLLMLAWVCGLLLCVRLGYLLTRHRKSSRQV